MRLIILFLISLPIWPATFTAASCSTTDVGTAIGLTSNGDTVLIPDGSCTWSSGLTVTKTLTIQGVTVPTRTAAATNGTTITYGTAGSYDLFTLNLGVGSHVTLANLRFLPGSSCAVGAGNCGNYLTMQGTGLVPLMHDVYFNLPDFALQHAVQWFVTGGVIWNTTFDSTNNLAGTCGGPTIGNDGGTIVVKSNRSWNTASTMGTLDVLGDQNLYIENSIIQNVGQAPDVDTGGRVVVRYSSIVNGTGLTHGTTTPVGGRQVEYYQNTITHSIVNRDIPRWFWMRAGTAVFTQNNIQAISDACHGNRSSFEFVVEDLQRAGGYGCCIGYMCMQQPGSGSDGISHTPVNTGPYVGGGVSNPFQISDPVYIWNNTGTGNGSSFIWGTDEGAPLNCINTNPATGMQWSTNDDFVLNRDVFVDTTSNPSSGAKPGWAPYTYPHPLTQNSTTTTTTSIPGGKGIRAGASIH